MSILKTFVPGPLRSAVKKYLIPPGALVPPFGKVAFSQEGEDLILNRLFNDQPNGFYVDVGAHHPFRYSNTAFFYQRGWRGINIDPLPGAFAEFNKARPRDINLNCGVAPAKGVMQYRMYTLPELNGFSEQAVLPEHERAKYPLVGTIPVNVEPLAAILHQHLPPNTQIDFLTVDVEGFDLSVLRSNDWERYRPRIVLVEDHGIDMDRPQSSEVYAYLVGLGFRMVAKTPGTLVFRSV